MNSEKDNVEIWKRIIWNGIPLFVSDKGNIKDKKGKIKNQN